MKKLFIGISLLFISITGYSQQFKGVNGALVVDNNHWILTWQNNNYKLLTDWAHLDFTLKSEVEEFYNDLNSALISEVKIDIIKSKYNIGSDGKGIVILYNKENQYMTIYKKYAKKAMSDIRESINYMNN